MSKDKQPTKEDVLILDIHQWKLYHKSECDETMLQLFPTRYFEVTLSDKAAICSKPLQAEIERLKGLIMELWELRFYATLPKVVTKEQIDKLYNTQIKIFKTENQI